MHFKPDTYFAVAVNQYTLTLNSVNKYTLTFCISFFHEFSIRSWHSCALISRCRKGKENRHSTGHHLLGRTTMQWKISIYILLAIFQQTSIALWRKKRRRKRKSLYNQSWANLFKRWELFIFEKRWREKKSDPCLMWQRELIFSLDGAGAWMPSYFPDRDAKLSSPLQPFVTFLFSYFNRIFRFSQDCPDAF